MHSCLSTILDGQQYLGGRLILVECKNIDYLLSYYKKFGFELIENNYQEDDLLQFFRIINEEEIIEFQSI